ncbi:uncharacterized protein UTRI_03026 [Ustilago trichophora]|uniref:Uncharacterized protein n=1 Tax=Ustilago trichophora TaxID=86804 RepID=A0A5C3E814_9BASI|nr:uncharacterized protein UTRI_03026 [Ustilago trichophora]
MRRQNPKEKNTSLLYIGWMEGGRAAQTQGIDQKTPHAKRRPERGREPGWGGNMSKLDMSDAIELTNLVPFYVQYSTVLYSIPAPVSSQLTTSNDPLVSRIASMISTTMLPAQKQSNRGS